MQRSVLRRHLFHQSPGADNAHAAFVNIVMPVEKNVKERWRVAVGVDPGAPGEGVDDGFPACLPHCTAGALPDTACPLPGLG